MEKASGSERGREMSNLDKVFERNRVTKLGIDAMITNYLRLERENAALREQLTAIFGTAWEPAAPYPEIASCIAEIRGEKPTTIRLDAERLNWLEEFHDCCDMTGYRYEGVGIELVVRDSDGWHFAWDFKPENSAYYDTLREIIDVAMQEEEK